MAKGEIICTIGDKEYLSYLEFEAWANICDKTRVEWMKLGLRPVMIGGKNYISKHEAIRFLDDYLAKD